MLSLSVNDFPVCSRVLYLHHFFSMFVNCLSERIRNFIFMLMSGNRSDLDGLIARVNEAIHRWSIENGLLLNHAKSQEILVSNSPPELPLPLLFLGDIALEWKDVVTDLGLLIDFRLRFGRHDTKICSRVYSTLHRLRLLKAVRSTCSYIGMSSWACIFLSILIFVCCLFFRLIRSERPRYPYSDFCILIARSSRTVNFIFPNVCARGSVLVRGIRSWNGWP
jgi:hypothetical protein